MPEKRKVGVMLAIKTWCEWLDSLPFNSIDFAAMNLRGKQM
jgi:hypothetical protein